MKISEKKLEELLKRLGIANIDNDLIDDGDVIFRFKHKKTKIIFDLFSYDLESFFHYDLGLDIDLDTNPKDLFEDYYYGFKLIGIINVKLFGDDEDF